MSCKICLFNPKKNEVRDSIILDQNYPDSEAEALKRNEKLNKKPNKQELYWKVTEINI